jgi:EAL and modified HD-GYP domain-containing signal transduction protein
LQTLIDNGQPLCLAVHDASSTPAVLPRDLKGLSCAAAALPAGARWPRPHGLAWLVEGARSQEDLSRSGEQGALAMAGWPMDDEWQVASPAQIPAELRGVLELMNRVEREEPLARLEAVLTADSSLAYRLLRFLNASAFGLRVEVSSFRHGLQMVGYRKLQRWLAMLLVTGCQDPQARVLMGVAARRGLILDELATGIGDDAMRSEMILCGAFSLLDRMLRVPLEDLVRGVPMPQRVQDSLLASGPYAPYLSLLRAIEGGSPPDVVAAARHALVGLGELNRAVLKGLSQAWELD